MGSNDQDAWNAERQREQAMERRARDVEHAKAQAKAKETIAATGKHHRKGGK